MHPYREPAPRMSPPDAAAEYEAMRRVFTRYRRRQMALGLVALAIPFAGALRFLYFWFVDPPCGFRCM